MSDEVAVQDRNELAVPALGLLVNLDDPVEVARTLADVRNLEVLLREAKSALNAVLDAEGKRVGTRTFNLDGGLTVQLSSGRKVRWDFAKLRDRLRQAGCPDDRIDQLIETTVSYKVNGSIQRQLETNDDYKEAIASARDYEPEPVYASIRRKGA